VATWRDALTQKPPFQLSTLDPMLAVSRVGQYIVEILDVRADEPAEKLVKRIKGPQIHYIEVPDRSYEGHMHSDYDLFIPKRMSEREKRSSIWHHLVERLLRNWFPDLMFGFGPAMLERRVNRSRTLRKIHDLAQDYHSAEWFIESVVAYCEVPSSQDAEQLYRQNGLRALWRNCVNAKGESIAQRLAENPRRPLLTIAYAAARKGESKARLQVYCGDRNIRDAVLGTMVTEQGWKAWPQVQENITQRRDFSVKLSVRDSVYQGEFCWLDRMLVGVFDLT